MKTKSWMLVLCLFFLAAIVLIWAAGWYLTKPVPVSFNNTPVDVEKVQFKSASGSELQGWLFKTPNPKAAAVLMHGIRSNRGQMVGGELLTPLLAGQIKVRTGIAASRLSPVREASRVVAATLVMSGDKDTKTTIADTNLLFEAVPEPKQLALIKDAAHVDLEQHDRENYWRIVEPFLQQHLR